MMSRFFGWIMLIFVINGFLLAGSTQLKPYSRVSAWEVFTGECREHGLCWYQISSTYSSAQEAVSILNEFLPADVTVDQSIQWRHSEGYQGYARFDEHTIASMEIRFPADLLRQDQILVGDVILSLGIPDAVEIAPFGQILLHYHDLFLVVRVHTGMTYRMNIHHPVARLQLFSPYRASTESNLVQANSDRHSTWRGFGSYMPQNP